jgi:hypothetical protein
MRAIITKGMGRRFMAKCHVTRHPTANSLPHKPDA